MTIRVVIADDEPIVRHGLLLLLRGEPDITVVGQVGDGAAAVGSVSSLSPDVILMDVRMPILDGVEATRRIVEIASGIDRDIAVLMLTSFHADQAVRDALRAGAAGFVLKDAAPEELLTAVRAVAAGKAWLDPAVAKRLLAEFTGRPASTLPTMPALQQLTPRESEILVLAAHGLGNVAIAAHLVLAEATVKTHINRILAKLGLHDRAQAVAMAYRTGLVAPTEPLPPRVGR